MYVGHFDWSKPLLWVAPDIFSKEECDAIIQRAEEQSWLSATVNSAGGRVVNEKIRNNDTAILPENNLTETLYQRLLPHVPSEMKREMTDKKALQVWGLFTPMRVYRYQPGQHFGLHHDQSYAGPNGTQSFLTVILYLNDNYTGGETDFPEQQKRITPQVGSALLFQHMLLHAGLRIVSGVKYVLRTDVLYLSQTT